MMIGWPNACRSFAYSSAYSYAARAMPNACAPTNGRLASNVLIAACAPRLALLTGTSERASSFSLPPSRQRPGTRTSSSTTSAVCVARMPIFLNFWPIVRPGVSGPMTKRVAAALQLGLDRGDDHVHGRHVRDAAVGDPRLGAVEHPLVLGLVVDRARAQRRHVGTGVGFAHCERRRAAIASGVPKHCGTHSAICSGVPLPTMPDTPSVVPEDRERDAGVSPSTALRKRPGT